MKVLVRDVPFEDITASVESLKSGYGNKFDFIQGKLTNVNQDDSITITLPNGNKKQI